MLRPTLGARKPRRRPRQLEHFHQAQVCKWLKAADICHAAIPNEGKRSPRVAAMMKARGMQPSFPDLLIFDSPPACPGNKGVAIEMKQPEGDDATEGQMAWQNKLSDRGWVTLVCFSAAEALSELARLGYRVPRLAS